MKQDNHGHSDPWTGSLDGSDEEAQKQVAHPTHPEVEDVDDFEILVAEVCGQIHVGTMSGYKGAKKLIGAYGRKLTTIHAKHEAEKAAMVAEIVEEVGHYDNGCGCCARNEAGEEITIIAAKYGITPPTSANDKV